jgi:peptide-methionine (R)-S-oxide reductase
MTRRDFTRTLFAIGTGGALLAPAVSSAAQKQFGALNLPASHWKPLLDDAAWKVLFREDTERPHSSPLNGEKRDGTYICAACYQPLFSAQHKYESGTGWPSFWQALPDALGTRRDFRLIIPRTEYHCRRCGGHQGHVFDDGPPPTGQRYCNNGLALRFVPSGEPLPALRP